MILDISMPGLSGLDILVDFESPSEKVNILILSFYPTKQFAVGAIQLRASEDICQKTVPVKNLHWQLKRFLPVKNTYRQI